MRARTLVLLPLLVLSLTPVAPGAQEKTPRGSGTSGPPVALSPEQRAALAAKDAARPAAPARAGALSPWIKEPPMVTVGASRPAAPPPADLVARKNAGGTGAPPVNPAALAVIRALMGPERAARFGLGKTPDRPPTSAAKAPSAPASATGARQ